KLFSFGQSETRKLMNQAVSAAAAMSVTATVTSVTHSYFPSLQPRAETPPVPTQSALGFSVPEESLFVRQGDYWIIQYEGRVAFLKATRGLQCLSLLLCHPGREFHVSELLRLVNGRPAASASGHVDDARNGQLLPDTGPILDAKAKAEYRQR